MKLLDETRMNKYIILENWKERKNKQIMESTRNKQTQNTNNK